MQEELVKFKGYKLNSLQLVKHKKQNIKNNDDGDLELESNYFQSNENKNMYKVVIDITLITDIYNVKMALEGYFEFDSKVDNLTKDTFLEINAPTILYPYCRSFISMISSFDGDDSIILPVINFANHEN